MTTILSPPSVEETAPPRPDELSRVAIAALDPQDMLGAVLGQPRHLATALGHVAAAGLERRDAPDGLLVCGMGGSAIGADLAAAAVGARARRPIRTMRDYALEPWTGADTAVLCASYSGNTEETLAAFAAAGVAGARRIALTTGGELARAAEAEGVPVLRVPSGFQPRAAVAFMVVGVLHCAAACGAAPLMDAEIERAQRLLATLIEEWGPDAPFESRAKRLALALHGRTPVIYGAGPTVATATRWKAQVNENVKSVAFCGALPEVDHNEICAWESPDGLVAPSAVFLEDPDQHPRVRRRIALTADLVGASGAHVERVAGVGTTPLERVLSMVLLGDLVSVYLAVLAGRDPTPVPAIERFKRDLADAAPPA